tara:strand:- start:392 stop:646 length:255 start_codon:yes stop_codon:yes gene_type:complete
LAAVAAADTVVMVLLVLVEEVVEVVVVIHGIQQQKMQCRLPAVAAVEGEDIPSSQVDGVVLALLRFVIKLDQDQFKQQEQLVVL